jgi:hypothetical protein
VRQEPVADPDEEQCSGGAEDRRDQAAEKVLGHIQAHPFAERGLLLRVPEPRQADKDQRHADEPDQQRWGLLIPSLKRRCAQPITSLASIGLRS